MGICCNRRGLDSSTEEILDYKQNTIQSFSQEPEISLEGDITGISYNLTSMLNNMKGVIPYQVSIITFIDLYNITLIYQENHTNSPYILFDIRPNFKQQDNFLKKMKHINYSYDDIKVMTHDKLKNLKRYLHNKTIIFILPDDNMDSLQSILTYFVEINLEITVNVLNINLSPLLFTPNIHKLYNSLDERQYSFFPSILIPYNAFKHINHDGFIFFINNKENHFSHEYLSQALPDQDSFVCFWKAFKITTILRGTSKQNQEELIEFNIGDIRLRQFLFYFDESQRNIDMITNICSWVKKQICKGNSFIISIEHDIGLQVYLSFILVILWKVTMVIPKRLIEYIKVKGICIDGSQDIIDKSIIQIRKIFTLFGYEDEL